jgi:IstB-like ATP binding protein
MIYGWRIFRPDQNSTSRSHRLRTPGARGGFEYQSCLSEGLNSAPKTPPPPTPASDLDPLDKRGAELLFQVITKRYERGSIIITINIAFKDWLRIFAGDATMTSALLDRLLHHAEPVIIEGDSYRSAKRK